MHATWLEVVSAVLRPARPERERCLVTREAFVVERARRDAERERAAADCIRRIEALRAACFAAGDGRVPYAMTELEREWRRTAKVDPDGGLMDYWAAVAPRAWHDEKRWRGAPVSAQLELATVLAADPEGVATAEAAAETLRAELSLPQRIRWTLGTETRVSADELFAASREAACERAARAGGLALAERRARAFADEVAAAARARGLEVATVDALATTAAVEHLSAAAGFDDRAIAALRRLWSAGYLLAAVDERAVTLAAPPL